MNSRDGFPPYALSRVQNLTCYRVQNLMVGSVVVMRQPRALRILWNGCGFRSAQTNAAMSTASIFLSRLMCVYSPVTSV